MKTLALLLFSLLSVSLIAQDYSYIKLKVTSDGKICELLDETNYAPLKDNDGKEVSDILDALLLMEDKKWEVIISYAICSKPSALRQTIQIGSDCGCCPGIEYYLVSRKKKTGKDN